MAIEEGPSPINGSKDMVLDSGYKLRVYIQDPTGAQTEQSELYFAVPSLKSARITVRVTGESLSAPLPPTA